MSGFFELARMHRLSSPTEAVSLAVCLGIIFWTFRRSGPVTALLLMAGALAANLQTGQVAVPAALAVTGIIVANRYPHSRELSHGFPREVAVVMAGYLAYEWARWSVAAGAGRADANADRVISFERSLRLFFEPHLQSALSGKDGAPWNFMYSQVFLAIVVGVLVGLYFLDRRRYLVYRNALGISTLAAIVVIALFPTSPPRLVDSLGIEDTVVLAGQRHAYVNEFAAIPSLHVGWLALTGYVLGIPLSGWRRWLTMLAPGLVMGLTVIATGNHYWLDAVIGSALAVGPAIAMQHGWFTSLRDRLVRNSSTLFLAARRSRYSLVSLGGLFLYLGLAQVVKPGFTDFWGYLFVQVGVVLIALYIGELAFFADGGLSRFTHGIIVVCCFADVFGTDGDLYARIDEYDKVTHFLGTAAITAGVYDLLRALAARRGSVRPAADRLLFAVTIGIAVGIGWEVYEYLGDVVFHTARAQGRWDTFHDLVSDGFGAAAMGALLFWQERSPRQLERQEAARPANPP